MKTKLEKVKCPTCGCLLAEYRHNLNVPLGAVLKRLFIEGGPVHIVKVSKSNTQFTNYAKLAYWGLAKPTVDETGKHSSGFWEITDLGRSFVQRKISIDRTAVVKRNEVLRFEGPAIMFSDLDPSQKDRPTYQDEAREQIQDELF